TDQSTDRRCAAGSSLIFWSRIREGSRRARPARLGQAQRERAPAPLPSRESGLRHRSEPWPGSEKAARPSPLAACAQPAPFHPGACPAGYELVGVPVRSSVPPNLLSDKCKLRKGPKPSIHAPTPPPSQPRQGEEGSAGLTFHRLECGCDLATVLRLRGPAR